MKRKLGIPCIVLGAALLLGALLLSRANQMADLFAWESAVAVMPELVGQIQSNAGSDASKPDKTPDPDPQKPSDLLTEEEKKMPEAEIDGKLYIGYVSIPSLKLELPVLSECSMANLKVSPCRYTGTLRGEDLVLMAHNYNSHFGKIGKLELGDSVIFTDVAGVVTRYEVVGEDILAPTDVEELVSGDFDLTLFTCTYSGKNRITVYCNKVNG